MVQCHQKDKQGGGESRENYYETWTLQTCPACGRSYKEFYSVELVGEQNE